MPIAPAAAATAPLKTADTNTHVLLLFRVSCRLGFDQPSSSYWSNDNQTLTPKGAAGDLSDVGTVHPTSKQVRWRVWWMDAGTS
jgi:hypothetical protein